MSLMEEEIRYPSSKGKSTVTATLWHYGEAPPRAIIHIVHGMGEQMDWYEEFAHFMAAYGFAVCGSDLPGRNKTGREQSGSYTRKGRMHMLLDIRSLYLQMKRRFPRVPYILLGHGLGALVVRLYASEYGRELGAVIFSGMPSKTHIGRTGIFLNRVYMHLLGDRSTPITLWNRTLRGFSKKSKTLEAKYDWLSRDDEMVHRFAQRSEASLLYTIGGVNEVWDFLQDATKKARIKKIPVNLPIYLFSGTMDPVGRYGKGVQRFYNQLLCYGKKNVTLRLYHGGRHEMLHEVNRDEVYKNVVDWLDGVLREIEVSPESIDFET